MDNQIKASNYQRMKLNNFSKIISETDSGMQNVIYMMSIVGYAGV